MYSEILIKAQIPKEGKNQRFQISSKWSVCGEVKGVMLLILASEVIYESPHTNNFWLHYFFFQLFYPLWAPPSDFEEKET